MRVFEASFSVNFVYFYGSLRAVQLRHAEVAEYDLIDLFAVFYELTEMRDGF